MKHFSLLLVLSHWLLLALVSGEKVELDIDVSRSYVVALDRGDTLTLNHANRIVLVEGEDSRCFSGSTTRQTVLETFQEPLRYLFYQRNCFLFCSCPQENGFVDIVVRTKTPTVAPTSTPTASPTRLPTSSPVEPGSPTRSPVTFMPSVSPTTSAPTTLMPTSTPTASPTSAGSFAANPIAGDINVPFFAVVVTVGSVAVCFVGALGRKKYMYYKHSRDGGNEAVKRIWGHKKKKLQGWSESDGPPGTATNLAHLALGDDALYQQLKLGPKKYSPVRLKPTPMATSDCPKFESLTKSDMEQMLGGKKDPEAAIRALDSLAENAPAPAQQVAPADMPLKLVAQKVAQIKLEQTLDGPIDPGAEIASGARESKVQQLLETSIKRDLERRRLEGTLRRGNTKSPKGTLKPSRSKPKLDTQGERRDFPNSPKGTLKPSRSKPKLDTQGERRDFPNSPKGTLKPKMSSSSILGGSDRSNHWQTQNRVGKNGSGNTLVGNANGFDNTLTMNANGSGNTLNRKNNGSGNTLNRKNNGSGNTLNRKNNGSGNTLHRKNSPTRRLGGNETSKPNTITKNWNRNAQSDSKLSFQEKQELVTFLRECGVEGYLSRANTLADKYTKENLINALIKLYGTAPPTWVL